MSKEDLKVFLKCLYTSARKKESTYYKSSSTKSIRAAVDRFLRSPPRNKPFSIISDPAFTEANKVLDAFVKDLRKTGKIAGVVHKKAISKEQVKKLYRPSRQFESCPVTGPGRLGSTLASFLEHVNVKTSDSWHPQCFLYEKLHKGLNTTDELNRRQPGSLPATENHQGGLADAEDESDAKIFSVPGLERCPVKTLKNYTWFISIKRQMLCFRDREMVKARSSIPQSTKFGFAVHLLVQLRSTTWWKRCQSEQV